MKVLVLVASLWLFLFFGLASAQEKGPLGMRFVAEWSLVGGLGGAALGAGVWLLDPGKEGNHLGKEMVLGASWGVLGGALFSLYIMNLSYIPPTQYAEKGEKEPSFAKASWGIGPSLLSQSSLKGKAFLTPTLSWRF